MAEPVKKEDEKTAQEDAEEERFTIDFSNVEGRKLYLKKKLDDLMDSIGDSYGKVLMDELIFRLEKTVKDFNLEVSQMMKKLHILEVERQKYLSEEESEHAEVEEEADEETGEISEFEKKLESRETGISQKEEQNGKSGKKGLFRR